MIYIEVAVGVDPEIAPDRLVNGCYVPEGETIITV